MIPLAADENFNADILRGLLRRRPDLDIARVQDAGLSGATTQPSSNGRPARGASSSPTTSRP
jgi:hypothetical protein